jgi:acyl-coenzyme A synthetase/AMP-(fatty) acid ligase
MNSKSISKSDLAALVLSNLSQKNVEKVVSFAMHSGLCIVCAKPHMYHPDFTQIKDSIGSYALITEDKDGKLLVEDDSTLGTKSPFLEDYPIQRSLRQLDYNWAEDEVAFVLYTSGSTGKPKGVCHSLQNLLFSVDFFAKCLQIKAHTKVLTFAPVDSVGGFKLIILSLLKQAKVEMIIPEGPLGWLNSLCAVKPDVLCCSPQLLESAIQCERFINAEPFTCSYYTGGALLAEPTRILFEKTFNNVVFDGYGTTETGGSFWINEPNKKGSGFEPKTNQLLTHSLVPIDGQDGLYRLRVNCKSNFLRYLGDERFAERDYQTGDIVKFNAGKVHLVGRENRSFKSKDGLYILHAEVFEQTLKKISHIKDAFVASEFNIELEPHVCYIDTDHAIDLAAVIQFVVQNLGLPYSRIKLAYANISRNADGKILNIDVMTHPAQTTE